MSQSEYPKWVNRAPGIGAVLVINKTEEDKLLESWDEEQLAEAEATEAKKQATLAKEAAEAAVKASGAKK